MVKAAIPANELERLAALERYGLLDTEPEAVLDALAQAAAVLCETPIALISFVDSRRQWFKSRIGIDIQQTPRDVGFCSHAILNPRELMEVSDVTLDQRFVDNPLVTGETKSRFYAGQPLVTPCGLALGTLCVLDRKPRTLTRPQRAALVKLAEAIMAALAARERSGARERLASERTAALGAVLEESGNEIYLFDETTLRFLLVNRGARDNLGYSSEELEALTPLDLKPEFSRETFEDALAPLRRNEKRKVDFVTVHQRKDGSTYPVEVHVHRATFESTAAFAAVIVDITQRTKTEQALAQARLFLESAPDATVIINSEGRIEVANSQTVHLLGYAPDELHAMPIEALMPGRYRAAHAAHREAYNANPKVRGMGGELTLFAATKDGREIPIEVSLSPIRTSDGTLVAAAIRDVTQRVAFEAVLKHAKDEAEHATATKSRFLAAASHDLRQPLQSLGLYLAVLERKLEKPANQAIGEKMRRSLDVMAELLDALLDVSTLDSGSIAPTICDFPLQNVFDRLLADYEPQAQKKRLEFRCEGGHHVLRSDPALLQRIVENFVSNAIRYTEKGAVEVSCAGLGDCARIRVTDTGAGIPEDALERIFEEYFQLDNPQRDRFRGLGLGLSIVKRIAKLLGHKLMVSSVLGQGSVFSVDVPFGQSLAQPSAPDGEETPIITEAHAPVVLLVDNDPSIVEALAMLLETMGAMAHTALNGDDALARISTGVRPDIIVTDFRLPGYNGIEMIRRIRQVTSTDLPTVLMTGDIAGAEIDSAKLANCIVLRKPIETERLIAIIKDIPVRRGA